jgi:protein-S-isoprenylcysteine O-methyltransferase Ste14
VFRLIAARLQPGRCGSITAAGRDIMDIEQNRSSGLMRPPVLFAAALAVGVILGHFVGDHGFPLSGHFERSAGATITLIGAAILFSAAALHRATGADPWGRTRALVTEGVYRWSRNPMYLGMAVAYCGIALFLDSRVTLLLVLPILFMLDREVIAREEEDLAFQFGDSWRHYRATVRRWI